MAFSENIKTGLEFVGETISEIAASVAEKNRLRTQLNHIKGLIKSDTATRDQAFIELGRYFYENMREGTSAENEAICAVIDAASDRISKASLKYVELLNIQNDTKIRSENAEKLAKAMADKAAAAAQNAKDKGTEAFDKAKEKGAEVLDKAKATAYDLKDKAADAAEDIKERFDPDKNAEFEGIIADAKEGAEKAADAVADAAQDVKAAASDAVEEAKEAVADAADDVKDAVKDTAEDVKNAVAEAADEEDVGF